MPVPSRYVLQQGPMLAALGKTAARAISQQLSKRGGANGHTAEPSGELVRTLPAPHDDLLDAYIAHVGG
ncbi:MAG TPA: hypothetical protein VHM19_08455, partial [Polyangiales bacterium]|nr:hypothetical protein [Polyangiales bacterium]